MRYLFGLVAIGLFFNTEAAAENHSIGVRVGLLGLGLEYSYRLDDRLTFRAGFNGSGFAFNESESGIEYAFDLDFDSLFAGIDIHPLNGKFRVSVGAFKNDSGLSATSLVAQEFTIGGTTYQPNDVGTLFGRVDFDSTEPYLGFGWDWRRAEKVGMALDIGILRQGSPIVSLGSSGPFADDPGFILDLAAEQAELQQSLDDFDLYPYAMFGVVVRF